MRRLLAGASVFINNKFRICDIAVSDGVISDIGVLSDDGSFDEVFELNNDHIVPGFVDVHVHLREPGFSYKETIKSGTAAAAAGGYTAVVSMPNTAPPPDCAENLAIQQRIIERDAAVKVYPCGCITEGRTGSGRLADYENMPDAIAFSDDGTGVETGELMREAMRRISRLGKTVVAHCEDKSLLCGGYIHDGEYARAHGHPGISSESEYAQIARDVALAAETGCKYHVCHVSTAESVDIIRKAKREGVRVTCETAPHYLLLCDEDLREDGRFKMNPPLRSASDRAALIAGIKDGTIDVIATDHAPHSAEEKSRGLKDSAMGIVGLETAFPELYTHLVKSGVITLERLVYMMSIRPREIFPAIRGGSIAVGQPADLTVLELNKEFTIDPATFQSMGRATPFEGDRVYGMVAMTLCGGKTVWKR